MPHGLDLIEPEQTAVPTAGAAGPLERVIAALNQLIVIVSSVALLGASVVLTYSVIVRYFLKFSTDWQDEMSVFLIIGAVFMSAAAIQARRGHVAIEAIVGLLPPRVNRVRQIAVGAVATVFMIFFMPGASVDTITQNVYEEMASITLLSIPLFILKGSAIGRSRAGQDLYGALHAWMHRLPGGLGIANIFACALFAAMAGSSPATCSAIGSAGIPEMRKRGYSGSFAAGIIAAGGTLGILLPPSITMILYAVASEQSLGRLFLAAIGPALLLVALFAAYAMWQYRREHAAARAQHTATGAFSELLREDKLSFR